MNVDTSLRNSTDIKIQQNNTFDKNMFLKVLAAQMKYQNPMEPQSNLESITQYASISQLEQLSNLANSMNMMMSNNMVGKNVTVKDGLDTVSGTVDKVIHDGNDSYLCIGQNKYLASKVIELYK